MSDKVIESDSEVPNVVLDSKEDIKLFLEYADMDTVSALSLLDDAVEFVRDKNESAFEKYYDDIVVTIRMKTDDRVKVTFNIKDMADVLSC